MKKLATLALALVLALSVFAFSASAEREAVTLTVLAPYFSGFDPADTEVQKAYLALINEMTGYDVTLEFTYYGWSTEFREKLNVAINAGDVPWDIIGMNSVSGGGGTFQQQAANYNRLGAMGYFVNLKDYDTPNMDALLEASGATTSYLYTDDGSIYFAPKFSENQGGTCSANNGIIIDKTVFDANEIAYPTTIEELVEAAKTLKEIYPDNYPIVCTSKGAVSGIGNCIFEKVFPVHQYKLGFDGTEFRIDGVTDTYRAAVACLREIYENELIAPDYAAWDSDMINAKIASGTAYIILNKAIGSDNKVVGAPQDHDYLNISYALAMNNGGWWQLRGSMEKVSVTTWGVTAVNAKSEHADVAVAVLDATLSEECHNLLAMGIQGVSWDYDADGNKVYINEYRNASGSTVEANPKMALGISMNGTCMSGLFPVYEVCNANGLDESTYVGFVMPDGSVEYDNPYLFAQKYWTYDNMEPENCVDVSLPSANAEELAYITEVTDPLYTYITECFAKFITGELDINDDAVWANYISECYTYDIDGVCDIYNAYIDGMTMYNK